MRISRRRKKIRMKLVEQMHKAWRAAVMAQMYAEMRASLDAEFPPRFFITAPWQIQPPFRPNLEGA